MANNPQAQEKSFQTRDGNHSSGIELVTRLFEKHGYKCYTMGTETDNKELYQSLTSQHDTTSRMIRFRPDRVHVKQGVRALLCEIKTEKGSSDNFAVEVESYGASLLWDKGMKHVIMAFVALQGMDAYGTWVDEIPEPDVIFVPRRWDFDEQMALLDDEWPETRKQPTRWRAGSGTPFILVPKNSLESLDCFIANML